MKIIISLENGDNGEFCTLYNNHTIPSLLGMIQNLDIKDSNQKFENRFRFKYCSFNESGNLDSLLWAKYEDLNDG